MFWNSCLCIISILIFVLKRFYLKEDELVDDQEEKETLSELIVLLRVKITFKLMLWLPFYQRRQLSLFRRWIEREIKKGLCGSHMYYLISSSWWHTWMDYVNFKVIKHLLLIKSVMKLIINFIIKSHCMQWAKSAIPTNSFSMVNSVGQDFVIWNSD